MRDVLPPFFSLIVCDLISDGGGYLQFAGRCLPTSSGSRVPPSLHLLKCLLALVPPLHLLKYLPQAMADAMPLHRYRHTYDIMGCLPAFWNISKQPEKMYKNNGF